MKGKPLGQRVREDRGAWAPLGPKRHLEAHPNDHAAPPGFVRVRVDRGDSHTPIALRRYVLVEAGFGLERRIARARAEAEIAAGAELLAELRGAP